MKKLLVILMSVVGLNAYATSTPGPLTIKNSTGRSLAAECFPSGNIMNGIADTDSFTCSDTDTVIYFGRTGISSSTTKADLDAITDYTVSFENGGWSNYHHMGDGKVWVEALNPTESYPQKCTLLGDPSNTVDCSFN